MTRKKCRELTEKEFSDYASGMSVKEIAVGKDISPGTIRKKLKEAGVIRSKEDAVKLARSRNPDVTSQSNLNQKENGNSYDAFLSQVWLSRKL
jgi:DNA-binding CsgD family transcriptional regulator